MVAVGPPQCPSPSLLDTEKSSYPQVRGSRGSVGGVRKCGREWSECGRNKGVGGEWSECGRGVE